MEIELQLYRGRHFPLPDVIRIASSAGYTHVEGYGALYSDLPLLKRRLDDNGLTMPTAHIGLTALEERSGAVDIARTLDVDFVVCLILPADQRPSDADGWSRVGQRLGEIAQFHRSEGFDFGYHNHDFEFVTYGDLFAIELLLLEAPSVLFEADIAWIARAGTDPLQCLSRNGAKIAAIHVKDLAAAGQALDEGGWQDVGYGTMPWDVLARQVRQCTNARYFVAEHDNPLDFKPFASRFANIRSLFAGGASAVK
jgi:sugar phosphate isomerase/epimerase